MYKIEVAYDTGDSFHQEHDVKHVINEVSWNSLSAAKRALKAIEQHYHFYMILHKEWNVDKKDKDNAKRQAEQCKWYDKEYPDFIFYLEDDNGDLVKVYSRWTGYFESMVGADIITENEGMSFRI